MPDLDNNHILKQREIFAAMAMQGLLANPELGSEDDTKIALWAVEHADALIKALASFKILALSAEELEALTDAS